MLLCCCAQVFVSMSVCQPSVNWCVLYCLKLELFVLFYLQRFFKTSSFVSSFGELIPFCCVSL